MATGATLQLPVLIRHVKIENKPYYSIRPLFLPYPVSTNRQYYGAISRLQQEIKDYFKEFTLTGENLNTLLWFMFRPELKYQQFEFDFNIQKQFARGNVGVATFSLQHQTFACLPGFNNFFFIVSEGSPLKQQVEKVAQQLLRRFKSEQELFQPEDYFSEKREFIIDLEVSVHIEHGPFKYQEAPRSWFHALLNDTIDFNGAIEIERVGYSLNGQYPAGLRRAFFMDEKVDKVYQIVFQRDNTPLVLVGPEGVGRHTLLHEVVFRFESNFYQEPNPRYTPQIWHVDPTRIIAGMSVVGMWEKRFEAIIRYLRTPNEQEPYSDKMLIDNPVALLRIGRTAQTSMTLSDILKPYLEKRQLQVVLIATPEEWKVIQVRDRRFSDLFQVLRLQEPDLHTSARIILQQRRRLEIEQDTRISVQAINQLLVIQRNYLRNKPLPGSVMKLLHQLAVKYRSQHVDAPEVREEFKAFSGLEEIIFDAGQPLFHALLQEHIRQGLVGQPDAADSLVDVIHLIKSRLADRGKPISSFLFIGPTGVGKTQAAKVLCETLMGSEDHMIRFDMNEFIDGDAAQRLIGDYYQPEGLLTGKVRYRPFGVLLLDEIEKAHPDVHDLLLQVLDDGRLTDSLGRTVDFSNMVIIMTSNIGAREISWQLGYRSNPENEAAIYRKAVENHFRPEFINRIDKIVIFNPLQLDHILGIARLQIRELLQRDGFVRRTTILNISQEALEWVARRGFDARMGGRALRRQIERDLTSLSAQQLVSTYTDQPVLLDIFFENDRLVPRITSLQFVAPLEEDLLPPLPDERKMGSHYRRLLKALDHLNEQVREYDEEQDPPEIIIGKGDDRQLDWLSFHFKNKILETRDRLQTILLGFQDKYFTRPPAIPLRLKRGGIIQRRPVTRGERENLRDRLFQEEGLRELSEAYYLASVQFDSLKSEFVDFYLDVFFLSIFARGFLRGQPETVVLHFRSLITGMGGGEIDFLMSLYEKLFEAMDLPHQMDKKQRQIILEGYSMRGLLKGEAGIHLFYVAHRNPLPILVSLDTETVANGEALQVIRIYDGSSTLTDLRTSYSNAANITANEMKFLLAMGVDPKIRAKFQAF